MTYTRTNQHHDRHIHEPIAKLTMSCHKTVEEVAGSPPTPTWPDGPSTLLLQHLYVVVGPVGESPDPRYPPVSPRPRKYNQSIAILALLPPEGIDPSLTRPPRRERERAAELSTPVEA
ncbi:hypothetical protein PGTUg99_021751 [Puccinia graminis f. sp. tritici]|uniref:Uncharacterized protein n=1 Tax=Puccinia graminis f. sp. tritici TaxID=56615 RepID=A0A5B0MF13_PUCGR|nr:hypothetical protein PGTUg99_021751 [Puccinia graminis f. sp. tritici]